MMLCLSLIGCGKKAPDTQQYVFEVEDATVAVDTAQTDNSSGSQANDSAGTQTDNSAGSQANDSSGTQSDTGQASEAGTQDNSTGANASDGEQVTSQTEPLLDEDGSYTSKDDVALYIHTYGKLPGNFITKKQAKKLGWDGGSLEQFAPGKCIGGDYFGNYEALLPDDKEYHECDIDTLGKKKRGAKRIIYSDDGYIYYTDDHYKTFELLYEP